MAGIRGKNTKPELLIRHGLFRRGLRFRVHVKTLPGCPDLVLAKHNAVIFVHGCFWHGHMCRIFKWPSTRPTFWREKILRNKVVDRRSTTRLRMEGWRVLTIWECCLKGPDRIDQATVLGRAERWLRSRQRTGEIPRPGRLSERFERGLI